MTVSYSVKIFRVLLGASLLTMLVLWALPYFDEIWLSEDGVKLRQFDGYGALYIGSAIYYWGFLIAWILCYLSLMLFSRYSRALFLILVVFSIGHSLLWGMRIQPPYEVFFNNALAVLNGVILGMAYLSPVRGKFEYKDQVVKREAVGR